MEFFIDGPKMTIGQNDITFDTDILFGANTISGTGDIYCNDLHPSSGWTGSIPTISGTMTVVDGIITNYS